MNELSSNGFASSIAQAIEKMKAEQGESFSLEKINLAELERRTGVSRGKLRRLQKNGLQYYFTQASHPRKATTNCSAGQQRPPIHDRAR